VAHSSPDALLAGVVSGMDLAHARALIADGDPIIEPHRPARDALALESLARWATRWSPIAAADQPDGLLLDITGCGHLFGGDRGLAASLRGRLRVSGITARVAVASTVGAAWGLARFGRATGVCVRAGYERRALAPLPIAALRLPDTVVEGLREVGVRTIDQVLALSRSSLPARYGDEVSRRLDQALGCVHESVQGVPEREPLRTHLELSGAATQWEAVALAVRHLLTELIGMLTRQESGLRRLDATFRRLDAMEVCIVVQVSRPTRSEVHLWSLIRPKLERLNLGYGITAIVLNAAGVVRIAHSQGSLTGESVGRQEDDAGISRALDTIAGRIGPDRVCRYCVRESHRPDAAAAVVPLLDNTPSAAARAHGHNRPSVLFAEPEPISVVVLAPDGPVMSVGRGGKARRIVASVGPERIGGEWWRGREAQRDYFRVQEETGRWLWIFRDWQRGEWFVHGEWA